MRVSTVSGPGVDSASLVSSSAIGGNRLPVSRSSLVGASFFKFVALSCLSLRSPLVVVSIAVDILDIELDRKVNLRLREPLSLCFRFRSSTIDLNRRSNALRRTKMTAHEMDIGDPSRSSKKRMNCWKVLSSDRLTVFKPVMVIAETTRKRESMYLTFFAGVEEPQKTMLTNRHTPMK